MLTFHIRLLVFPIGAKQTPMGAILRYYPGFLDLVFLVSQIAPWPEFVCQNIDIRNYKIGQIKPSLISAAVTIAPPLK